MRILMQVEFPHQPFNAAVRDGTVEGKMSRILQDQKPESVYFVEMNGRRCGIMVVDIAEASKIPAHAEPWFLTFDADVKFHPTMTPDDLARAGLGALGKKWA